MKQDSRGSQLRKVVFQYYAPQSEKVGVAGAFNDWDYTKALMKKDKDGIWKVEIALAPGRYEYRYYVDGNWQNEQHAVECVPNAFGTWNCVIRIS